MSSENCPSPTEEKSILLFTFPKMDTKDCEEKIQKKKPRYFLYFVVCAVNLASFNNGVTFTWPSPELPRLSGEVDPENNPLKIPCNENEKSWIASLLAMGSVFGPFVAGCLMDRIGRKPTLILSTIPLAASYVLYTQATTIVYFYIGRFLCGFTVGCFVTIIPFYITEVAEDDIRGALGMFMQIFTIFGMLYAATLGAYTNIYIFNLSCMGPLAIFIAIFAFCPESPYYLIMTKDEAGAEKALESLRNNSHYEIQNELRTIKWNLSKTTAVKTNFLQIFNERGSRNGFIFSLTLIVLQQFVGIGPILSYTQDIFSSAGTVIPSEFYAIILCLMQLISSIPAPTLIEKLGKRRLLFISLTGVFLSVMSLGTYFHLKLSHVNVENISWLPIVAFVTYNLFFCIGMGPIPWIMISELLPTHIKSSAAPVIVLINSLISFAVVKWFVNVSLALGIGACFWMFGASSIVAIVFIYRHIPETTGKSLQEIQSILEGNDKGIETD